ncbi:MAG: hypothetical protein SCALA702_24100 [Melioribacteraceae bacterium]|nr:MAG: hypothetical protein SCALA702_24100 [Melioribacteraceae bacterium]
MSKLKKKENRYAVQKYNILTTSQEIPRYEFERIVKKHSGDKRVRRLRCRDQFTGLLYHQLTKRNSLRDLVSSYNSNYKQFYYLGSNQLKRSTLSDANNKRSYKIFEEVFNRLLAKSIIKQSKEIRKVVVIRDGKTPLILLTNDMKRSAEEIAELYKRRWQIELFFKWVKQNLKVKTFLGTSENAVKIQVITALIAFLLLRITQKNLPFNKSLQIIARLMQTNLMRKIRVWELFIPPPDNTTKKDDLQFELNYF